MRTKVCASVLFTSAAVLAQGVESPRIPSPPYVTADIKTAAEIPQKPHPSPAARVLGGAVQPTGAAPAAAPFAPAAKAAAGGLASSVLGGALRGPIYDGAEDGDVWVWQPTFKARVGNRATTFYPFLGADVPSAWVEFRSPSVQIAGHSIPGRDAVAVRTEDRIALDRGSYVERFDVSDAGIEQSFVFSELPRRGDLTIQIPFGGPLRAQLDDGVVVFSGAHGGARYGRAVAFDARGERVAVTTALHGSTLRLTVAEAFVARARLPLVVDPMISPVSTITSATTIRSTDVSYDVDTDTHIVLVQVGISTTDQDVFAYLYQGDFSSGFAITTIDASTDCWEEPRVANNRLSKTFLVVAQVSANCSSPYWIAGRLMDLPSLNRPARRLSDSRHHC